MITAPCKDCEDRIPGCHSSCPKYNSWKKEMDELKSKIISYKTVCQELRERKKYAMKKFRRKK